MLDFRATVSALVYTLVRERVPAAVADTSVPNGAVNFVLARYRDMPDYLRFPMWGLTLAFDGFAMLKHRRPFHSLDQTQRAAQVTTWRTSKIGPMRDLIKFYESLGVFGFVCDHYERPA